MKALVGTFNQEKASVGAFSVIVNLRLKLYKRPSSGRVEAHAQGIGIESFIALCLLAVLPIVLSAFAMYGLRNNSIKGTLIYYVILEI